MAIIKIKIIMKRWASYKLSQWWNDDHKYYKNDENDEMTLTKQRQL